MKAMVVWSSTRKGNVRVGGKNNANASAIPSHKAGCSRPVQGRASFRMLTPCPESNSAVSIERYRLGFQCPSSWHLSFIAQREISRRQKMAGQRFRIEPRAFPPPFRGRESKIRSSPQESQEKGLHCRIDGNSHVCWQQRQICLLSALRSKS